MNFTFRTSRNSRTSEGQATYGIANLRSEKTGLPFVVFISQKDDARHAARVKVSPGPRAALDEMGSYAVAPFGYKAGKRLSSGEEAKLERWVALNRESLEAYWDGAIEYTEDAIARIQPV